MVGVVKAVKEEVKVAPVLRPNGADVRLIQRALGLLGGDGGGKEDMGAHGRRGHVHQHQHERKVKKEEEVKPASKWKSHKWSGKGPEEAV